MAAAVAAAAAENRSTTPIARSIPMAPRASRCAARLSTSMRNTSSWPETPRPPATGFWPKTISSTPNTISGCCAPCSPSGHCPISSAAISSSPATISISRTKAAPARLSSESSKRLRPGKRLPTAPIRDRTTTVTASTVRARVVKTMGVRAITVRGIATTGPVRIASAATARRPIAARTTDLLAMAGTTAPDTIVTTGQGPIVSSAASKRRRSGRTGKP